MNQQTFDFHSDLLRAVLWQYEEAGNIQALARYKAAWFEHHNSEFWRQWYADVFNIDTANDFGLSVWAKILNIPLGIDVPPSDIKKTGFGFGKSKANFASNFRRNNDYTLTLTTEQKRLLIRMRYFNITTRPSVTNINEFMRKYFGNKSGSVFVLDPLDMTYVIYVFNYNPDERLRLLLDNFDMLPRPSGVGVKYRIVTRPTYGFGEEHLNFNNGNFGN